MNDNVKRCRYCRGGPIASGKTTLKVWRDEQLIVIRDVPADVCQQCKAEQAPAEVMRKVEHFLQERHRWKPVGYLTAPQYSMKQLMSEG